MSRNKAIIRREGGDISGWAIRRSALGQSSRAVGFIRFYPTWSKRALHNLGGSTMSGSTPNVGPAQMAGAASALVPRLGS